MTLIEALHTDTVRARHRSWAAVVCAALALTLAGCASTSLNAQWSDPQFKGKSLRGAKVLVACQAGDMTLRRICADRNAAQLSALGALPVQAPDKDFVDPDPAIESQAVLRTARAEGAVAVLRTSVAPSATMATPGPSIGIGIGGFGGGYRSGGGVGFGMSAPVGGGSIETGFSANASLTDVASGQLMWSASATAPPSADLNRQLDDLSKLLLDTARQAGFFPS